MSEDEEMMIRGRLMTEYVNAKRKLVALQVEAERMGKLISEVGECLQNGVPFLSTEISAEHYAAMNGEKVQALVADIQETTEVIRKNHDRLSVLGLV